MKKPFVNSEGFSLIEILVVLAIVGIITAIALPSYQQYTLRGGRAEGKTALLEVASLQERFYSINSTYSTNADPINGTANFTSESGKYIVTVAACSGGAITSCFLATATPQTGQASDTCAKLTLSSTGVRGSSAGVAADCWAQ